MEMEIMKSTLMTRKGKRKSSTDVKPKMDLSPKIVTFNVKGDEVNKDVEDAVVSGITPENQAIAVHIMVNSDDAQDGLDKISALPVKVKREIVWWVSSMYRYMKSTGVSDGGGYEDIVT
jgi:hypothetical protein